MAKRWKSELNTDKKVYILSPYITSKTAENVVENVQNCEIYTDFNIENFLFGTSSITTLRNLIKKGFKVFDVPQLHAKIILVIDTFVSIGSQNLTNQGTKNKEATFTSTSLEIVKFVEKELAEWLKDSKEIYLEMIEDLEKLIKSLKRQHKKLKIEIKRVDEELKEKEQQRIKEQQRQSEYQERLRKLKLKLKEIEKTQEYVRGSIDTRESKSWSSYSSVWTFMPNSYYGSDLLNWQINSKKIRLARTFRYLAIIEDTGKLAWARVMKTRITKYESYVFKPTPIILNERRYEVIFMANWDSKTLPEYNIEIIFREYQNSSNRYNLLIWYFLDEIKIHKIKISGIDNGLLNWIEGNKDVFKALLINNLLEPFKYRENSTGEQANSFLEIGKSYELRVRRIETQNILSFKHI